MAVAWFFKFFGQDTQTVGGGFAFGGTVGSAAIEQPYSQFENVGDPPGKQLCDWLNRHEDEIQEFRMLQGFSRIYRAERELS